MTEPEQVQRAIDLPQVLDTRSCFLFGPRQTGKSWLIRNTLGSFRLYNLLDSETFLSLSRLRALAEEKKLENYVLVCLDRAARTVDGIQLVPWDDFLIRLWAGKYS